MFLFYDWPFLHVRILQENWLFSTLIADSVYSDCLLLWGHNHNITTGYFQNHPFWGRNITSIRWQTSEFQGHIVTVFRFNGQFHNHVCQVSSGYRVPTILKSVHFDWIITLAASSGKRNVTAWRPPVSPSVCLSRWHTHRNSPGGSIQCGERTFRLDNKEDRHTCSENYKKGLTLWNTNIHTYTHNRNKYIPRQTLWWREYYQRTCWRAWCKWLLSTTGRIAP